MKSLKNVDILLIALCLLWSGMVFGQFGKKYDGPDDPAGDEAAFRSAYFAGNRMLFFLNNNTSICDTGSGVSIWNQWPKGYQGVTMVHGINAVMAARVYVANNSIPVTDINEIRTRTDLDTLYYAQQGFRNRTDMDPTGSFEWGMKPVFGYFNELSESFALSDDSYSWPPLGWPANGNGQLKWPGEWNGRYGRGVTKADLEAFYVMNDAQDQEYLNSEAIAKYYPRPGVKIGDKNPNVSIQKGLPWGGLGLRLEIRAYQWNNPEARDITFFEYTTANISDYDLPEMCFGFYFHPFVGQDGTDDYLYFQKGKLNMAYNWDSDGIGTGGIKTCTFGIAYLESPGMGYDNIDNDQDGLLDEKRDNTVTRKIGPYEGIVDLQKFLEYYNYTEEMLAEHWDADEDQDWVNGTDTNNDGIYQVTEDAGDDVGLDGVGPGELNYTGPDEGECNGQPDYKEGVGCEPNFASTDVSESDMLGLTSFHTFDHDTKPRIHADDVQYWKYFSDPSFDAFQASPGSWVNLFATGIFPLYQGRTERISMGLMASYDPLEGLNSSEHSAPSLIRKKEVAQIIYERDYRFAQPPKMPTLKAEALDGKVVLTWDDMADTKTREAFLGNINDFEGYKLYKATDKFFIDAEAITDGYGNMIHKKPIFQCDLIDHKSDFTDYGLVDGVGYYLGTDSGIQHYFVDTNVENGKTYYYGLVAYDYGISDIGNGVSPTENNLVITLNEAEEVISYGQNVQIVTPRSTAAGYVPPQIELLNKTFTNGSGTAVPNILAPGELKTNHIYKLKFEADTLSEDKSHPNGYQFLTNGYTIYDETENKIVESKIRTSDDMTKAPIHSVWIDSLSAYTLEPGVTFATDRFDGLSFDITLNTFRARDSGFDTERTGWKIGNQDGKSVLQILPDITSSSYYPWEFEIIFGDEGVYATKTTRFTKVRDENSQKIDAGLIFKDQPFNFYVLNKTFPDSAGNFEVLDLIAYDSDSSGAFDLATDRVLVGLLDNKDIWYRTLFVLDFSESQELPEANDVYRLAFNRPFFSIDSLRFRVLPSGPTSASLLKSCMDSIQVVPNPYVATNRMETSVANHNLNQRRKIMFTHLPARCEIKIFTVSGVLIDEIDVENPADNGIAFWDLNTREDLEIAAGIYIYYVKAKETGDEKIGKFGVIK